MRKSIPIIYDTLVIYGTECLKNISFSKDQVDMTFPSRSFRQPYCRLLLIRHSFDLTCFYKLNCFSCYFGCFKEFRGKPLVFIPLVIARLVKRYVGKPAMFGRSASPSTWDSPIFLLANLERTGVYNSSCLWKFDIYCS